MRLALVVVLAVGCVGPPSQREDAPAPAPSPPAASASAPRLPEADFDRCDRCHVAIAAVHERSLHARAANDVLFRRELARVPDPAFCVHCHGADREPPGLGCSACHGDGVITTSHESGRAPHPVRVDPSLGTDATCAGCHQFDFPGRPGEPMQATMDEASHLGAEGERARCIDCHGGAEGHAFEVSDAMLVASVRTTATVRREGATLRVRLVLRAGEVGHAVPTGDVYRRLEVRAWVGGAPGTLRRATLAREFDPAPDGLHERADRRVPPGGSRVVELRLPVPEGAEPREIRWAVEWHALPREEAERDERAGHPIDDRWWRRVLAEGLVPL